MREPSAHDAGVAPRARRRNARASRRFRDPRSGRRCRRARATSLDQLRISENEAREARDAADWAWAPSLSVSGGVHIRGGEQTDYGYVAGLSLALPVFSQGEDLVAAASARAHQAATERDVAERTARIEIGQARARLGAARSELVRFEQATAERLALLERAVQTGYVEGERSVVEVVDAQRARTEVERRKLSLELAAKRAELALRAARGELE